MLIPPATPHSPATSHEPRTSPAAIQPNPAPVIRMRTGLATASTPPHLVVANCQSHSAADQMVFPLNPRRRPRSSAAYRGPGLRPHLSDAAQWGRNAPPRRARPATTNARTRQSRITRSHSRPCTIRVPVPPTNRHAKPPFPEGILGAGRGRAGFSRPPGWFRGSQQQPGHFGPRALGRRCRIRAVMNSSDQVEDSLCGAS